MFEFLTTISQLKYIKVFYNILLVLSAILPPFLFIFEFERNLFIQTELTRLILLVTAVALPIWNINYIVVNSFLDKIFKIFSVFKENSSLISKDDSYRIESDLKDKTGLDLTNIKFEDKVLICSSLSSYLIAFAFYIPCAATYFIKIESKRAILIIIILEFTCIVIAFIATVHFTKLLNKMIKNFDEIKNSG